MLVPGRVENWVIIVDLDDIGLTNVPAGLKKMIASLQINYKARLAKMFVLNASFFIRAGWMIVEGFMDPVTRCKIQLSGDCSHPELRNLVSNTQLPAEYGGIAPAPGKAWPPTICPDCREDLVTQHLGEEEMKNEIKENARVVPPPGLADFARANCKSSVKKGVLPHKTYYLQGRIERRDSFNGVIPDLALSNDIQSPEKTQDPVLEEKAVPHARPIEAPRVFVVLPADSADVNVEIRASDSPAEMDCSIANVANASHNGGNPIFPKVTVALPADESGSRTLSPIREKANEASGEQCSPVQLLKPEVVIEAVNNSTAGSAITKIQPRLGKRGQCGKEPKTNKACCACVIV